MDEKLAGKRTFIMENRNAIFQRIAGRHSPEKVEEVRKALHELITAPRFKELPGGTVALALQMATDDALETMIELE